MIVESSAPTRISLFGGGTDTEPFVSTYGGICISLAINIRQHIELTNENQVIKYPENASENFYWAILNEFGIGMSSDWGFKSTFDADIRTGLGSSASAAVALVGAIAKAKGIEMTRQEIAEKAWDIEVNKLKMFGGKQDQIAAAFGGMNVIGFGKKVLVNPVDRDVAENIADNLLLFDTRYRRTDVKLQENLKVLDVERTEALHKIKNIAVEAMSRLDDIERLANLLLISWEYKKESNKVSTPEIDKIYQRALRSGALSGKLLGSGGGGAMTFIVKKDNQAGVIEALTKMRCKHLDFEIDWTGLSTRIL